MVRSSFRERAAMLSQRVLRRVGDRAFLADDSTVMGTFENPFIDSQVQGRSGKGLSTSVDAAAVGEPRFCVLAAEAARLPKGSILTMDLPADQGGGRYRVIRPEPLGDGMVNLVLGVERERTADIR